jgi:hypothetical protein
VRKKLISTPSTPSTVGLTVVFSFAGRKALVIFHDLPFADERSLLDTEVNLIFHVVSVIILTPPVERDVLQQLGGLI